MSGSVTPLMSGRIAKFCGLNGSAHFKKIPTNFCVVGVGGDDNFFLLLNITVFKKRT